MSSTTIPGIKAKHAVVTSVCRANKGVVPAANEAVERLVQEYLACVPGNPPETKFHFILTVERPAALPPAAETPQPVATADRDGEQYDND